MAERSGTWRWPVLLALLPIQLWVAHAVVMFAHEYAHSVTAWALGWKASPFDLHFPPPSLVFWLIQLGVNQKVDEAPIFASGHAPDAALIALAGAVVGNLVLTLPLSRLAYRWAWRRERRGWAMLAYWCTAASIGNLYDYVPIRTFTLESDMGSVQRGFGCSHWAILVGLGIPTTIALGWWLARGVPEALRWAFPGSFAQRAVMALASVLVMFGYYGMAGFLEGGPVSFRLSEISVAVLLPLAAVLEVFLVRPRA